MSVTSIPKPPTNERREVTVEFLDGDIHPAQLIYALAGVARAMDAAEMTTSST
ncbi:MAG: hypothetical protein WBO04_12175 [Steroidobacteraceae bacterium]